ncbi:MAG: efflux RND transporter permease subunit [Gammaproteobacteria bacterium]|nr:efflux RND transporter permease subunit [Gammaproteobacteria bacterium]
MSRAAELGVAGLLARRFQEAEIVPLLFLMGLLLGLAALIVTPKEEDPQIEVTFANVFIPFPGATAKEVSQLVTIPAEQEFAKLRGVKHVYSVSRPGMAVLNVRFEVGVPREPALSRLYNAVFSTEDWLPANLGVGRPLVKPKGIDDVPVVTITLWPDNPDKGAYELSQVASALEAELKNLPGTRNVYSTGLSQRVVRVTLDPERMAAHRLALDDLPNSFDIPTLFEINNYSRNLGDMVVDNHVTPAQGGVLFNSVEDVEELVVAVENGERIMLRDIARVEMGPATPDSYVWYGTGPGASAAEGKGNPPLPAVTLAVAKKTGENAVVIAERVLERLNELQGFIIPEDVKFSITRDYGKTAWDKASRLLMELLSATFFVVLLVFATMSWREGLVVGLAVVITLAFTLFANWAWGFTLNRVSLFALIFSIGILVDDAIVVVENIHRNLQLHPHKPLREIIPLAVHEVGSPTIVATFAIVVALMPMAFITGLMGPYMAPIPINASTGMIISMLVAFTITPWLALRFLKPHAAGAAVPAAAEAQAPTLTLRLFRWSYAPFVDEQRGGRNRLLLLLGIALLILGSLFLAYNRQVVLKMLPFDNKSEFQIMVDMPEGTTLEQTSAVMSEIAERLRLVPEVSNFTAYAGTHSPVNFNGLVRQYYQRQGPNVGDIQVNLVDKEQRQRQSHDIALAVRADIQDIAKRHDAALKVVEVPPGPPVPMPLVAEIYGPEQQAQQRVAQQILETFRGTPDIVDTDSCIEAPNRKLVFHFDRARAAQMGTAQMAGVSLLEMAVNKRDVSYLHLEDAKRPVPVRLELEDSYKADIDRLLSLKLRSLDNQMVSLSDFTRVEYEPIENAIYHKDLKPYVFVMGDMAGELDSPLYGMWELHNRLAEMRFENGQKLEQYFINPPADHFGFALKWDGEWQVTYETFRDMGIAYSVGIVLIYLLVVAHFRSYLVPLIIMAPIPLTIIGVLPGHWLLGAQFTATSMIGMMALAGIIVRNSIILVDFIDQSVASGMALKEAVIQAGALRAKPIFLTAVSAMLGGFFILADPIFNGLAISLIFGLLISTLLTLLVIPVAYYRFYPGARQAEAVAP